MIAISVPKDIRKTSVKFIGPFTKRNCIFLLPVLISTMICYPLLGIEGINYIAMTAMILIDGISIVFGFFDFFGLPSYIFFLEVIIPWVLGNQKRPYATKNTYEIFTKQHKITYDYIDGTLNRKKLTAKEKKKKLQREKRRLEKYYKQNPDMIPVK